HVGHERELRRDRPFAGALLAAAALDVEAEGRGGEAAPPGLVGPGEQRADRVIEADVRRRVGARGPADRGLIDVDHVADVLAAGEFVVLAGEDTAVVEERIEAFLDDRVDERAFPRPRGTGHANELLQWDLDADVLEVVVAGPMDDDRFATGPPALAR